MFAAAPAGAAVFVLRGEEGSEPYVGKSSNLRRRLQRLLGAVEGRQAASSTCAIACAAVEWTPTGSDFEASLLLYKTLRREFPKTYGDRLRLRFAPLVKLILDNPYPRATVTTRISGRKSGAQYFGPFADARGGGEVLPTTRWISSRCGAAPTTSILIPAFPGCIYSEMKMCLAPCFKGCTDEEYAAEVERVQQYFAERRTVAGARDRAACATTRRPIWISKARRRCTSRWRK